MLQTPTPRRGSRLHSRLAVEALEDRSVPATLFVDDSLLAGVSTAALGGRVTLDRDNSGTLTVGDQVTVALGETGQTTHLTFGEAPVGGDVGSAYQTIQAAVNAPGAGDTIAIAKGTYAEAVSLTRPLTLDGLTGIATDVVIHPPAGVGVTVAANGVTLSDLRVTAATDGIAAAGITGLTLTNVQVDTNTGAGMNLASVAGAVTLTDVVLATNTGGGLALAGATGSTLALTRVSAENNGAPGLAVTGVATAALTDITLTGNAGTQSLGTAPGGTVSFTATAGATPYAITATGSTLQFTRDPSGSAVASQPIGLTGATTLNLVGGSGADTFSVTPAASGGATITVNGGLPTPPATPGDVLDLDLTGLTGTTLGATSTPSGFAGTFSFSNAAPVAFTGIESFPDAAVVGGLVFNDANGNGVQNTGETGLAGVTVQLDAGANGTIDQTAVTDSIGRYAFLVLPGTYRVTVALPTGGTQTTANPADINAVAGGVTSNANFGVHVAGQTTGTSTVTGVVFADLNDDGLLDAGERGLNGLVVFLDLNGNGRLDTNEPATTTSTVGNVLGSYTLTSSVVGTTAGVRVVEHPGFLTNTTNAVVALSAGATVTVNVGVQANIPPQATPSRLFAVGLLEGDTAHVVRYSSSGQELSDIPAFTSDIPGGARVAMADLNGDGVEDLVIASGPGTPSLLRAIDGRTGQELFSNSPFGGFMGGMLVTVGDVTGDGLADVIVTPDRKGGPVVRVFRGGDFQAGITFFGLTPIFRGGVRAAVGDVNGDGFPDIIVSASFGGGPVVQVFDGRLLAAGTAQTLFAPFFGFPANLRNGAFVAVGDFNGDGFADIAVGAGPNGGPVVMIYSGVDLTAGFGAASRVLAVFFGSHENSRQGIQLTTKDLNGDGRPDLLAADPATNEVIAFNGLDFSRLFSFQVAQVPNSIFVG